MRNGKKIIVILPAYNEEGKIGNVVKAVKEIDPSFVDCVLVVDDGSGDRTSETAEKEGATVIRKEKNRGVGAALRTGIDYAAQNKYDVILVMAGDDQDVPAEIPTVLKPILENGYDFVQGSRRIHGRRTVNMPLFRRITTKIYSIIFRFLTGFPCTDGTNGFRAFKADVIRDGRINIWQDWLDTYELEPYLFYNVVKKGYRVCEAPVTKKYHKKIVGYTKMMPVRDWWKILRPLIFLKTGIKR